MKIYILRHAIAFERGPNFPDDSKRPLTPEGMEKMRQGARGMQTLKLSFDLILSSPYVRAKQTAEIVAKTFKIEHPLNLTPNLTPDASCDALLKEIRSTFPKAENILLVGHEPNLSSLVSYLLIGKETIPIHFKKGGLCGLETKGPLEAGSATLNWLLNPTQLTTMY